MKKVILLLLFFSSLSSFSQRVQGRRTVGVHQLDARFTFSVEKYWSGMADAESYYFYVQNNTSQEYKMEIEVTLTLGCGVGTKTYKLGINRIVYLEPNGQFTPDDDWVHSYMITSDREQQKQCLIQEGDTYTLYRGMSWRLSNIVNITEEKAQKEAAAKKKKEDEERARLEKEAAAKKKKEDEERARLEREAAEKKKREEEEKARQAKAAEKQNSQGNNSTGSGGSGSYSSSPSSSVNTAAQNRQSELERQKQLQIEKNEEIKRQQQIAQEQAEQKRQQQFEEMQAKLAEKRRKTEALNVASQETMNQWSQGNYLQGSTALVNEYAAQGNSDAALTTLAVGTGLEIINMIGEEKRRKEEAEERRAEQARRAEEERRRLAEIEAEKQRILDEQKREFNLLVEENRQIKKSVIRKRDEFLNEEIKHTPTFDIFSEDESPLYIFYVQTDKDYNQYYENVSFPSVIEISINENASLHFSPIIAISPNSSGEYPFIKEMLSEIKSKYVDVEKGKHKIYNWSRNLEEIQTIYNQEANVAIQSYFTVVFPEEAFINHSDKNKKTEEEDGGIDYWGGESNSAKEIPKEAKEPAKKDEKEEEIDYWSTPSK